jgi:hypothetical protein
MNQALYAHINNKRKIKKKKEMFQKKAAFSLVCKVEKCTICREKSLSRDTEA